MRRYYVYIVSSHQRTLYTGVSGHLQRRIYEHENKLVPGFTSAYNVSTLVYFEEHNDIRVAIGREKQIKRWSRRKKITLIESMNPEWKDLSLGM